MEELQEEIRPDDVFVVVDEVVGAEVTEENAYHEEALAPKDTSETRRLNEEILRVLTEKKGPGATDSRDGEREDLPSPQI
ncbi:hypothetical protein RB195_002146 [Necator americanus]|uniref:Uncharacterized protein n=1 Tax=Necator americanus TaxID=51031 RepID=A0ABR1DIM2_NECAM